MVIRLRRASLRSGATTMDAARGSTGRGLTRTSRGAAGTMSVFIFTGGSGCCCSPRRSAGTGESGLTGLAFCGGASAFRTGAAGRAARAGAISAGGRMLGAVDDARGSDCGAVLVCSVVCSVVCSAAAAGGLIPGAPCANTCGNVGNGLGDGGVDGRSAFGARMRAPPRMRAIATDKGTGGRGAGFGSGMAPDSTGNLGVDGGTGRACSSWRAAGAAGARLLGRLRRGQRRERDRLNRIRRLAGLRIGERCRRSRPPSRQDRRTGDRWPRR